jgi:hypothetical protein
VGDIFVGDTPAIILDTGEDITGAATRQIKYVKPASGDKVTRTATAYNTTYARYKMVDGELDEPGLWVFQTFIDNGTWKGHGEIFTKRVLDPEVV